MSMQDVREEYHANQLESKDLLDDPVQQAKRWVDEAINADLPLPNAMTLATVSADGQPSSRTVLLKGINDNGFTFYTHYESRKGQDIAANAKVSFVMFWPDMDRQLIVMGEARKLPQAQSEAYFASRPRGSQLSAAASPQSQPVSLKQLTDEVEKLEASYPEGSDIPKPADWGGYCIVPSEIHFWHGRPSRLHDRFRYRKQADGSWLRERLAP